MGVLHAVEDTVSGTEGAALYSDVESLLGPDAEGQAAQDLRDRLVLATRYLANWYRATEGSDRQAYWWEQIDVERAKVETAYRELSKSENTFFPGHVAIALYADAAGGWPPLWRELSFSVDSLPRPSLLTQAATLVDTIASTPALLGARIGNELGKLVGDTAGNFLRRAWPILLLAGGLVVVYVLREPLARAAGRALG